MCSKKPIVASNLESIKEILSHKKNSYLVEPGSPLAIAKALEELINNKSLSKDIAYEAYRNVEEYSWVKRGIKINSFIENLLLMTKKDI